MSDKTKITLTRATFIAGEFKGAGEPVELPTQEAAYFLNSGFATEGCPEPEAEAEAEAEAEKAPAKKAK